MRTLLSAVAGAAALALVVASAALSGPADRPFAGSLVGSAGGVPDLTCPLGFRTVSEATGTASHLGRVTMTAAHCFTPPNVMADGHMMFVAANGDELHTTYTGTCAPAVPSPGDVVVCGAHNVVVGGTGRFAAATGEAHLRGTITFRGPGVPWPASWTFAGSLGY